MLRGKGFLLSLPPEIIPASEVMHDGERNGNGSAARRIAGSLVIWPTG